MAAPGGGIPWAAAYLDPTPAKSGTVSVYLQAVIGWLDLLDIWPNCQWRHQLFISDAARYFYSLSLSLSLSNIVAKFSRWTWVSRYKKASILDFRLSELRVMEVVSGDNWSYDKTCKVAVILSPPTNQLHFYWCGYCSIEQRTIFGFGFTGPFPG